jgi:hypothetical protein
MLPWYGLYKAPWLQWLGAVCATWLVLFNLLPAIWRCVEDTDIPPQGLDITKLASPYHFASNITTNLIVATTKAENVTWTERFQDLQLIPNLNVIRYISDDETARYHPEKPKAREALMYFTYLRDFYDNLADVNIFVHAKEVTWHMDDALQKSLTFALARLDLDQVLQKGYLNLRTTWEGSGDNSCPNGFSTRKTLRESPKGEEFLMGRAFRANFPGETVPEILSGPCCSQFAVSKDAVRSRPLKQYERSTKFLLDSSWSDQMIGRTWEHMWPYLFKEQPEDCHDEWRMLCMMYGVCFHTPEELRRFNGLWEEKHGLEKSARLWREIWHPKRLVKLAKKTDEMLLEALNHGADRAVRDEAGQNLT